MQFPARVSNQLGIDLGQRSGFDLVGSQCQFALAVTSQKPRLWPGHSGLDGARRGVPSDGDTAAEIGLVGHVASQSGVVAEDGVFREWLAGLD